MNSHCVWLDREAITSHLCLPMTTKPSPNYFDYPQSVHNKASCK